MLAQRPCSRASSSDDEEAEVAALGDSTLTTLRKLHAERTELSHALETLQLQSAQQLQDLEVVPALELEVLHHADRADALEQEVVRLQAQNRNLGVLAHARTKARTQVEAAARMRYIASSMTVALEQAAFVRWKVLTAGAPPSDAIAAPARWEAATAATEAASEPDARKASRLAQLEYDSHLLKRLMRQQAQQARHTTAANMLRMLWLSRRNWLLSRAWSVWLRFPPAARDRLGMLH